MNPLSPADFARDLTAEAFRLGFAQAGWCPAVAAPGYDRLQAWLSAGFAGEMSYLADRLPAYAHPDQVLTGARSLLVLLVPYRTEEPVEPAPGQGKISRYAWGQDYHDLIRARLHALADFSRLRWPGLQARGVIDTAPLLEREFAQLAGLGWIGKNTLLLNRTWGSFFFLAVLLIDQEVPVDEPFRSDHCGTCTACLDACPTDAFVAPYVLDSRKCLSYLTIELRDHVPRELRPGLGSWVFGCDVCQDVCPWNRKAPVVSEPALQPRPGENPLDLRDLLTWDEARFRQVFRATPLWRARRRGVLRNAALVLGNQPDPNNLAALETALRDVEPLVRGAAAWALGRQGDVRAIDALRAQQKVELDPEVLTDLESALVELTSLSSRLE